jgi:hypothetical protein
VHPEILNELYCGLKKEPKFVIDDLIVELEPPTNRRSKCDGHCERHLTEAAVMLAYGIHLLETVPELDTVELHPDGEHAKRFEIANWLSRRGFVLIERRGSTSYSGEYAFGVKRIIITSTPGKGDVVAKTSNESFIAECKGGIVNTRHPGQQSRLRKGLCEAVGLLMARERTGRQVAVVPHTAATLRLAKQMAPRAMRAGIEIALLSEDGRVIDIRP